MADADGDDDIFTTHGPGGLGVTTSDGDRSFAGEQVVNCDGNPRGLEVGYINDDCVLDIVTTSATSEIVCLFLSNRGNRGGRACGLSMPSTMTPSRAQVPSSG